jgi:hypothetical protein
MSNRQIKNNYEVKGRVKKKIFLRMGSLKSKINVEVLMQKL